MDLVRITAKPTTQETEAVDSVLGPAPRFDGRVTYGGHSARAQRRSLLPALHAVQDATGAVSRGALGYICDRLDVAPAEAYGVATFYALFRVDEPGSRMAHICDDLVCSGKGTEELCLALDESGQPYERSPCLGQCDRAPAVMYHDPGSGYRVSAPAVATTVSDFDVDELPVGLIHQPTSGLRLLRRIGVVDPTSLDAYLDSGGFQTLAKARDMGPSAVIDELKSSNLRGRGGAAFPVGVKWDGLRNAAGAKKYVIANGDESEPGTFKDRVLMEGDPFALVEAMAVYGFATGARHGVIYVRGEYPTAERRLRSAVEQTADRIGDSFTLEVRRGAGAYICGEETALFASIEGHRGEPRQKPPFPTQSGLFGMPTGVNNIETLLATLEVVAVGGREFAQQGTTDSTGPKLFCLSGAVTRPGVFEVPFGVTIRELIDLAGGPEDGIGAVLVGGAAGTFVGEHQLDLPLTFEDTREEGMTLGSGAVVVFGKNVDFGPVLSRIARFFRDESCGQCVPCRVGTARQEEVLARVVSGTPLGSIGQERERLNELAAVMTDASICGLGQTAGSAIQSAMRLGLTGALS